jgi:hypothetical protein
VSDLLMPLARSHFRHGCARDLPQIELACGDEVTALVLRHLEPLSEDDLARLRAFGQQHGVQWWLQPKGPDTVRLLDEGGRPWLTACPSSASPCRSSRPTSPRSTRTSTGCWWAGRCACWTPQRHERVIDWFCGLGNFTLPLATQAGEVLGIEGSEALVARSRENLVFNQAGRDRPLAPTRFEARNLFDMTPEQLVADGVADKWLVDPPREGAFAWPRHWPTCTSSPSGGPAGRRPRASSTSAATRPRWRAMPACWCTRRATAALAAGVVNMFPHTAHVESMAVFELDACPTRLVQPGARAAPVRSDARVRLSGWGRWPLVLFDDGRLDRGGPFVLGHADDLVVAHVLVHFLPPAKTAALPALGLLLKQSSMLRTAWRQALPMARASASFLAAIWVAVSMPRASQPASRPAMAAAGRR